MAAPQDLIDAVLEDDDGTDPTSLNATQRRETLARKLHQMNAYIHDFRSWEWTFDRATITLPTGENRAPLPDNYQELSRTGGAWVQGNNNNPLVETHRRFIEDARRARIYQYCHYFAIWDTSLNFTFTNQGAPILIDILFRVVPELIQDQGPEMLLPNKYCWTVLFPGFLARIKEGKNDSRANWTAQLRDGLSQMCEQENPGKTEAQRLPLARRRAW